MVAIIAAIEGFRLSGGNEKHVNNAVVQATACSFLTTIARRNHGHGSCHKSDGVSHILDGNADNNSEEQNSPAVAALQALSQLAWLDGGGNGLFSKQKVLILVACIRGNGNISKS
jgi:hypothetical protein